VKFTRSIAPVCTTELGLVAALQDEFDARNVNVIGLSANELSSHEKWIADINEINNVQLNFPIIADEDRKVSVLYDMLDQQVSILF
jgi:alkyl hydroperoxide reductase subunit AhpC